MRTLVRGTFQPTLEEALLRRARELRDEDPLSRILILVPNRLLARHLSLLLARRLKGWLGLEIVTLARLVHLLAAPVFAREGLTGITRLGRELLLHHLVREDLSPDSFLRPFKLIPGLPGSLLATVRDLEEGRISPSDMSRAADSGHLRPTPSRKILDLARTLERYQERKGELSLFDSAEAFSFAAREARSSPYLAPVRALIIYGFYDLNPLQRALIESLAEERPSTVLFPHEDAPAFAYAEGTLAWFRDQGFAKAGDGGGDDDDPRRRGAHEKPAGGSLLDQARKGLFRDLRDGKEDDPDPTDDSLLVISAASEEQEVREAIRLYFARLRRASEPLTCGVLFRYPEDYQHIWETMADLLDLSLPPDRGTAAGEEAACRAGRLLLELCLSAREREGAAGLPLGRRQVMEFACAAPLSPELTSLPDGAEPAPRSLPAQWDLLSMRLGIRGGDDWEERLTPFITDLRLRLGSLSGSSPGAPSGPSPGSLAEGERERRRLEEELRTAETLLRFIVELRAALSEIPERGSWPELGEGLRRALGRLFCAPPGLEGALAELDSLHTVAPETYLEEFSYFLRRALAGAQRTVVTRTEGASLWEADLMAARGVPADVLVIPGLTEGGFPRRPRQDPLLLDHERQELNEALAQAGSTGRLSLKLDRLAEERLLLRLALGSARRSVVLATSRLDQASGRERIPSSFLLEIYRAATGEAPSYEGLSSWKCFRRTPLPGRARFAPEESLEDVEFDQALLWEGERLDTPTGALIERRPDLGRRFRVQEARWGSEELNAYTGLVNLPRLSPFLPERLRPGREAVSPTRLETYGYCPHKYFLKYLLGVEILEEPEAAVSLSPLERGSLYHEILYAFMTRLDSLGLLPWDGNELPRYRELLESVREESIERFRRGNPVGPRLFWEEEEARLKEDLAHFLAEELAEREPWRPAYFELSFGRSVAGVDAPPDAAEAARDSAPEGAGGEDLTIRLGEDFSLSVRGRIDRVDLSPDGRRGRLLDYKTGGNRVKTNDPLEGGRSLQLPLYAMAAGVLLSSRHPELVIEEASFYRVTARRGFGKSGLRREEWERRKPELALICRLFIEGIAQGLFFPFPRSGKGGCSSCDFQRVCGPGMTALAERKRGDERTAFLRELREG